MNYSISWISFQEHKNKTFVFFFGRGITSRQPEAAYCGVSSSQGCPYVGFVRSFPTCYAYGQKMHPVNV